MSLSSNGTRGVVPLQVTFTATASEEASYSWYVVDRQSEVDGNTLTYTFRNAGTYPVVVSAMNGEGEIANDSVTISASGTDDGGTDDGGSDDGGTDDGGSDDGGTDDGGSDDGGTDDGGTDDGGTDGDEGTIP